MSSKWSALALVLALVAAACSPEPAKNAAPPAPQGYLKAFKSEAELKAYIKKLRPEQRVMAYAPPALALDAPAPAAITPQSNAMPAPPPQMKATAEAGFDAAPAMNAITNNQVQGVDEGDIVKSRGDMLIVLRRGRLFTVSLAHGEMHAIDSIAAYPPDVDAYGDWYDEMLVAGDRILIIGYSYTRGGTEINRFRIADSGKLAYEDTYQLRSNDYYSARNYASRLIGNRLVFYSPQYLGWASEDIDLTLPAIRRWTGEKSTFERIGSAREVYMSPAAGLDEVRAVHTVTSCDVTAPVLNCKASSVLGPPGRVFFVATDAVYVWTTPFRYGEEGVKRPTAIVYRLPLDGGAPSALAARGAPTDQFSFRESAGAIDVLIRADSVGDAMWASEISHGRIALLHISVTEFGDGSREIPKERYRGLKSPGTDSYYAFQNRFVGDFVLYGVGSGWGAPQAAKGAVFVAPVDGGDAVELQLPHGVDRLEAMGQDGVVVGADRSSLYFSSVLLRKGQKPVLGDRYALAGATQSETRSHGFFFKPGRDPKTDAFDGSYGVLGLPVTHPARPAWRQLFEESAAVVFVRRTAGKFAPLGELSSHPEDAADDRCIASCVDWYGNARPIFLGDRVFALMGYEIVEGTLGEKAIAEKRRLNYAPG